MPGSLDELLERWRRTPDATATIEVADALGPGDSLELIDEVKELGGKRHLDDVKVLLAIATMLLRVRRLDDAEASLTAAGKVAPRSPLVFRRLGEVQLRLGDAEKAERTLEKAVELGAGGRDTETWLERARAYKSIQIEGGTQAVAGAVQKNAALDDSMPFGARGSSPEGSASSSRIETVVARRPPELETQAEPAKATRDPKESRARTSTAPPVVARAARSTDGDDGADPTMLGETPRAVDILGALARVGVYDIAGKPIDGSWAPKARETGRGNWLGLVSLVFIFVAGSLTVFALAKQREGDRRRQAETLLLRIDDDLASSRVTELEGIETTLGEVFDLDPSSRRASILWLRERVLVNLLRTGPLVDIDGEVGRALDVGAREAEIAFARVASAIFDGDVERAKGIVDRWDPEASGDPYFQLAAGLTLERMGDAKAQGRFATALSLMPKFVAAEISLGRCVALAGNTDSATTLARSFRARYPDRAEPAAILALAWGRDKSRTDKPPAEVEEVQRRAADLPKSLGAVPPGVAAIRALLKNSHEEATKELELGYERIDGPDTAVWLGDLAMANGEVLLARKIARTALELSQTFPPARVLAARIALSDDRLDEALTATSTLPESTPDVAAVKIAMEYEELDSSGLMKTVAALPADSRSAPALFALVQSAEVLLGSQELTHDAILELGHSNAPWGDLLAVDAALDQGDLDTAEALAKDWTKGALRPARAVRLARLYRYRGKLEDSEKMLRTVFDRGVISPRAALEKAMLLAAQGKPKDVGQLLRLYPALFGIAAPWIQAYTLAAFGKVDDAQKRTARLELPPAVAAVRYRTITAMALGAMKDRARGVPYVTDLAEDRITNPDVLTAAARLGFKREERPKQPLRLIPP